MAGVELLGTTRRSSVNPFGERFIQETFRSDAAGAWEYRSHGAITMSVIVCPPEGYSVDWPGSPWVQVKRPDLAEEGPFVFVLKPVTGTRRLPEGCREYRLTVTGLVTGK